MRQIQLVGEGAGVACPEHWHPTQISTQACLPRSRAGHPSPLPPTKSSCTAVHVTSFAHSEPSDVRGFGRIVELQSCCYPWSWTSLLPYTDVLVLNMGLWWVDGRAAWVGVVACVCISCVFNLICYTRRGLMRLA